ncbi:bacterio-opsin activator domain-containing protein [Halalkalicoccus tibetensis]|uniref:Bacterio-opsin activator domain-containing protein n=1 Tax=Halalkalicoccus tibetensis TaxID=175632 RepID=A0ABD5UXR5_9EURY
MASIIEFRLPIEQFALAHTFDAVSDLRLEIERFAAQDDGSAIPFAWVSAEGVGGFEDAVADDPSVESVSLLADGDGERLYRMNWTENVESVVRLLLAKDGAIMSASAEGDAWEFQMMCPEHYSLSEIYDLCEENGLSLTVDAIYELGGSEEAAHGLTDPQHTSLLAAKEMGYYDVPRSVSLSDLADELGVSHQALSERLRRGHGRLIDRTLGSNGTVRTERPPEPE